MKRLKKAVRALCLMLLLILALFGVGLSGGVAIPVLRKRDDTSVTIELVESKEEQSDTASEEFKP